MRKQIAAANWKMNLTYQQGEVLLNEILDAGPGLKDNQEVLFAVPFPYLPMAKKIIGDRKGFSVAAQNCHHEKYGAYTGEVSAPMLASMQVNFCLVGHSERREYNHETNKTLSLKVDQCIDNSIIPVFCCGEPLSVREAGTQNEFVATQLRESLFHLSPGIISTIVIAYEPIWAIGTGKTASTAQAQDMHAYLRTIIEDQYGKDTAQQIPVLYGGSVKAGNAAELFAKPDVDGGLVGGASLVASDFTTIIRAMK